MPTVTVSKKGWVVIPKEIRERHGIKPGGRVDFVEYGELLFVLPALEDPVRQARGFLKGGPSLTKALLEERREEREREERKIERWMKSKEAGELSA